MREIKFRAWNEYDKEMITADRCRWQACNNSIGTILMQYTGLKDKNGKEIYEGDILLHHHKVKDWQASPIKWRDDLEDTGQGTGICGYELNQECANDAEIIGNIYENPELLEDK